MAISTTITKKFFEMKMADLNESSPMEKHQYFYEYKDDKLFWKKRLDKFSHYAGFAPVSCDIVFLVGSTPHRFKAVEVERILKTSVPEKYQSAIHTVLAYAIKCVPLEETVVIAGKEVLKDNDIFTVRT